MTGCGKAICLTVHRTPLLHLTFFPVDPALTTERAGFQFALSFLQEAWTNLEHLFELCITPQAYEASISALT